MSQFCPLINNPRITRVLPRSQYCQVAHILTLPINPPPKIHHLKSLMKSHKHKKQRNSPTHLLQLPNVQIALILPDKVPSLLYPKVNNSIPTYQSQAQVHLAQTKQQQQQINIQNLMPYSGFTAKTTLQQTPYIPASQP